MCGLFRFGVALLLSLGFGVCCVCGLCLVVASVRFFRCFSVACLYYSWLMLQVSFRFIIACWDCLLCCVGVCVSDCVACW